DLAAEPVPDLLEQRRRWHRIPQMVREEPDDLTRHLQVRDVGVQVDPVDALDLQRHVPVEDVVNVGDVRHRATFITAPGVWPDRTNQPPRRTGPAPPARTQRSPRPAA